MEQGSKIVYIILFATLISFLMLYVKFACTMRGINKISLFCLAAAMTIMASCGRSGSSLPEPVISVSIAPFRYFVEQISGDDFSVNVMVMPGADPHIYEPYPRQMHNLRRSAAYISNGFLSFEMVWLDRFYEASPKMLKLSVGERIDLIGTDHDHDHGHHHGEHAEIADPHYWIAPRSALIIAESVRDLLTELNPGKAVEYQANFGRLSERLREIDNMAGELFAEYAGRAFMIFHPALGYIARDYNLEEVSLEHEGKEPSPARMKELIDRAVKERIKVIFVQKEHDIRNARAIANETGAEIVVIDPLSEKWEESVIHIIEALHKSFVR